MKSTKTTYLVRIALLMAITIVLAATPLGYIPAGVLSFTIMVLPVAIGGVLMGTPAGLILGLFTAFVCIVPRVCVGLFAGLMHNVMKGRQKQPAWLYLLAGGGSSFVNTALFVGMIYLFCHGIVENAFGLAIWSSTLLGGVVEMAANAVLTMAIAKALERFVRPAA